MIYWPVYMWNGASENVSIIKCFSCVILCESHGCECFFQVVLPPYWRWFSVTMWQTIKRFCLFCFVLLNLLNLLIFVCLRYLDQNTNLGNSTQCPRSSTYFQHGIRFWAMCADDPINNQYVDNVRYRDHKFFSFQQTCFHCLKLIFLQEPWLGVFVFD